MIGCLVFPIRESIVKPNEYDHHYLFIKKYAELAGIKVVMSKRTEHVFCTDKTWFSVLVNDQQAIFDYSDHQSLAGYVESVPYFKFQYNPKLHNGKKNLFPTGPLLDIRNLSGYHFFLKMCQQPIYTCNTNTIINCQQPRHNALERRQMVQKLLKDNFGTQVDTSFEVGKQVEFWNKHKNCLVAVCVPGARNNMLDRGHYEQLALGACTISPEIHTLLPHQKELMSQIHYLSCADDYSDLIEIIKWCKGNRDKCRTIGNAAKKLFWEYCRPQKYWQWIDDCLKDA